MKSLESGDEDSDWTPFYKIYVISYVLAWQMARNLTNYRVKGNEKTYNDQNVGC